MYKYFLVLLTFLLIFSPNSSASALLLKGRITDRDNGEPLAFVSVSYDQGKKGVVTNIEGEFVIVLESPISQLRCDYVGYHSRIITIPESYSEVVHIQLVKKSLEIDEVVVNPGVNPAHRIIEKVIDNRDLNNPEKMHSFSYTVYNKTNFSLQEDTLIKPKKTHLDTSRHDTLDVKINHMLDHQDIMLIETVNKRNFKFPDKNNEKVILSRVSGMSEPSIMALNTKLQSFSFYNDFVTLLDNNYLNPISPGSTQKYFFLMQDTLFPAANDTVFIISYRPRKGRNFDGLKGTLYINTNGYAIQNVIASPAHNDDKFSIKIQQRYDLIGNKQWFPTQLNTDFLLKSTKIKTKTRVLFPVGSSKSYLYDIRLDPDIINFPFTNIEFQMEDDAYQKNDPRWQNFRYVPLDKRDSATYHMIDSIGKARRFDDRLKLVEALVSGYIPAGPFNIDYRKIFGYNEFEGFRMGLGLATNQKVSSFFSIGGSLCYAFKDKKWKNGAFVQLFPSWSSDSRLTIQYLNDVAEVGGYKFLDEYVLTQTDDNRNFLIKKMLYTQEKEASYTFRAFQYMKVNLYINQSIKKIPNYIFVPYASDYDSTNSVFHFVETGINVKFAYNEKLIKAPSGKLISLGTNYPMIWFNIRRGMSVLEGKFEYTKYEGKISKTFTSRSIGETKITLTGGKIVGDVPVTNLYNGHGSFASFSIEAENSFATMRMDEFNASEFVSVFFKQNFGRLLFNKNFLHPDIVFSTNVGFGKLTNAFLHKPDNLVSFNKGYYESGILAKNLLSSGFINLGLGVYYRYGPYTFMKISDNFCYRLTMDFDLK